MEGGRELVEKMVESEKAKAALASGTNDGIKTGQYAGRVYPHASHKQGCPNAWDAILRCTCEDEKS